MTRDYDREIMQLHDQITEVLAKLEQHFFSEGGSTLQFKEDFIRDLFIRS